MSSNDEDELNDDMLVTVGQVHSPNPAAKTTAGFERFPLQVS